MRGVNKWVSFSTKYSEKRLMASVWKTFTGQFRTQYNINAGIRPSIINKVVVGFMIGWDGVKIVGVYEEVEEQVTLVLDQGRSWHLL